MNLSRIWHKMQFLLSFQRGHAQPLRQSQSLSSQCSKPCHGRILGGPRRPQARQRCNLWVRNPLLRILEQWKLMAKLGDWWPEPVQHSALVDTIFSESRPESREYYAVILAVIKLWWIEQRGTGHKAKFGGILLSLLSGHPLATFLLRHRSHLFVIPPGFKRKFKSLKIGLKFVPKIPLLSPSQSGGPGHEPLITINLSRGAIKTNFWDKFGKSH